jgi:N-acetylated-alpha-linked acidic dipeptidase
VCTLDCSDLQLRNDANANQLPGRTQFKHIIFGPSRYDASESNYIFPFIRDAIERHTFGESKDWKDTEKQIKKTADILNRAAERLVH